ncbi:MAG: endonuclease/exonuclease/phosphatase family protein [Flavobacteriales bacterium]|nr:endonuclease/exonuclease/phosphatase family protein [Flavobacteriales bacterium]
MKIISFLVLGLAISIGSCTSGKSSKSSSKTIDYQIAFYNVENLFDTINQDGVNDGEYTPDNKKEWNSAKYYEKLAHIEQVLSSIDSTKTLACVGLSEVENRGTLDDLVQVGFLKNRGFKVVHFESPDFRGIDVAFLYDPKLFTVNDSKAIYVDLQDGEKTTRDILKVKTTGPDSQNLIMYINHWPSRWGGTEETNPKRVRAAAVLRADVDNEFELNKSARVLIMGDLNDYPDNESVLLTLGADSVHGKQLYNATWPIHKVDSLGTHNYRGHWGTLDQIIVSSGMVSEIVDVYPFKRNFMMYQTKKGEWLPSRTYSGDKYYAGYSDHLPIVIHLKTNKK